MIWNLILNKICLFSFPQEESVLNSKQATPFNTNFVTVALKINTIIIQGNKIYS